MTRMSSPVQGYAIRSGDISVKSMPQKHALRSGSRWIVTILILFVFLVPAVFGGDARYGESISHTTPSTDLNSATSSPFIKYRLGTGVDADRRVRRAIESAAPGDKSSAAEVEWVTIFSDDFESEFPGSNWDVWRSDGSAEAVWDVWTCWYGDSPTKSAGCAAGGSQAITCYGLYPNDMDSWLVYGPFSLADPRMVEAEFSFNFTLESEQNEDYFYAVGSTDEEDEFDWVRLSGSVPSSSYTEDLTDAFELGNLLGQEQVWLGFLFRWRVKIVSCA